MHPNILIFFLWLHDIYSVLAAAGAEVLLAGAARPGGGAGGRHRGRQQSASGGKLSEPSRLTLHCPSADSARLHDRVSQAGGPPAAQHEGPGGHQGGTTHHTLVIPQPRPGWLHVRLHRGGPRRRLPRGARPAAHGAARVIQTESSILLCSIYVSTMMCLFTILYIQLL